jgi:ATP-dependent DNA ligase
MALPKRRSAAISFDTLSPMEARLVDALPDEAGWHYEPKWDGFRCLACRDGSDVELKAKSGKSLSRFFPEVIANLKSLRSRRFILDGELVIRLGDELSFDALQARLHPAESRIKRLAALTPAILVIFDCLRAGREEFLGRPFIERRAKLEAFFAKLDQAPGLALTPFTRRLSIARAWLKDRHVALDGIVAKQMDLPYRPGERAMLKVKNRRTADCVVGGFRYETGGSHVGSLLLGLYDEAGRLHHVGFTSALSAREKPALTKRLERLIAPPGFTGDAPGGPSRWSNERSAEWQPLRPRLVVEVSYDHITGHRFRHGTRLIRWRLDKAPRQCTFDQFPRPAETLFELS